MEYTEIDIDDIVHTTAKAVLVRIDKKEHWIPLFCVDPSDSRWEDGGEGTINVAAWFAEKEGLV